MKPARTVALAVALTLVAVACAPSMPSEHSGPPAKYPYEHDARSIASEDLDVLEHADTLAVLRLSPEGGRGPADGFHGFAIASRADVTAAPARRALVDAVKESMRDSDGRLAKCFDPRHGISAKKGARTVDLVMCFECSQLYVYGERPSRIPIAAKTGARLDQLFAEQSAH